VTTAVAPDAATGTRADLQRLADLFGYALVPKQQVANWRHVLVDLITQDRIIYAIKLWAEVVADGEKPDVTKARAYIEQIRNHTVAMPVGNEHPDLAQYRLDYYVSEPWKEQKANGARTRDRTRARLRGEDFTT